MAITGNLLLRTGGGAPSPTYSDELARAGGLMRQPPTLARLTPRPRPLQHIGHTPAVPLVGRFVPNMDQQQIPAFPQVFVFYVSVATGVIERHTSPVLPTPSLITEITLKTNTPAQVGAIQLALTNTVIASDAEFAACPLIFKLAPETMTYIQPYFVEQLASTTPHFVIPLNTPLPNGPRNRICARVANLGVVVVYNIIITVTVHPL